MNNYLQVRHVLQTQSLLSVQLTLAESSLATIKQGLIFRIYLAHLATIQDSANLNYRRH